jgi:hypothetical protein
VSDAVKRSALVSTARDGFSEVWQALHAGDAMRQAFASTRLVAELLRISRRLRSLERKETNGELRGFVELAGRESARRLMALANREDTERSLAIARVFTADRTTLSVGRF